MSSRTGRFKLFGTLLSELDREEILDSICFLTSRLVKVELRSSDFGLVRFPVFGKVAKTRADVSVQEPRVMNHLRGSAVLLLSLCLTCRGCLSAAKRKGKGRNVPTRVGFVPAFLLLRRVVDCSECIV